MKMDHLICLLILSCTFVNAFWVSKSEDCVNGLVYDDTNKCECFACFVGPKCETLDRECVLPAQTNQAFVAEEWWTRVKDSDPVVCENSAYRTGYLDGDYWGPANAWPKTGLGSVLGPMIHELHSAYGNVKDLDSRIIVPGNGATQLIHAALYAIRKEIIKRPVIAFSKIPYYYLVPLVADLNPAISRFNSSEEISGLDVEKVVQFLISPNNPDGLINQKPFYEGQPVIQDAVFNWPSYTHTVESIHDIVLFSMSKLTGHSGSRLGWALVKDPKIAKSMAEYIYISTHGVSVDSQMRSLRLLHAINTFKGEENIFEYISSVLESRWNRLEKLFEPHAHRFKIRSTHGFCLLWLDCVDLGEGCAQRFEQYGIAAREGIEFGKPAFIRINLMLHDVVFEVLMQRLKNVLFTP